jgi:uncharacterized delta-60 repeat protein
MKRHEIHAFKKVLLSMILITLAAASLFAANGELDASFRPAIGVGVNGNEINALAVQPDGKIIVGGTFEILNGVLKNRLARFNADGSLDANFYLELKDDVKRIFVQPNGQILVAGASTLLRLNADGSPDNNFNSKVYGTAESASFQADGKIIIGGRFSIAGSSRQWVARLNADGSVDESFNVSLTWFGNLPSINAILVQPDGKVYVGGGFNLVNGVARSGLVRLNSDGSLDETFPPQLVDDFRIVVYALARQPDGKILVSGSFNTIQGVARNKFARLNADGTLDASFVPLGTDALSSFFLQPDGRILINTNTIQRLNADGSADATFVAEASAGQAFALLPDGKVLSSNSEGPYRIASITKISRLSANGTLESSFQIRRAATGLTVYTTLVQPDGKILIGGGFETVGTEDRLGVARLNRDGTVDVSFNPQGFSDAIIHTLALQPDGKILVGGLINRERSNQGFDQGIGVLRLNSDGSRDESFGVKKITAGSPVHVRTLAVQADGKIYVGGSFQNYDDVQKNGFARLNADGSLDNNFTLRAGNGSIVNKIIVQPDGKILVGGKILPHGTTNFRYALERFNPDNTVDAAFNSNLGYSAVFPTHLFHQSLCCPTGKFFMRTHSLKD